MIEIEMAILQAQHRLTEHTKSITSFSDQNVGGSNPSGRAKK